MIGAHPRNGPLLPSDTSFGAKLAALIPAGEEGEEVEVEGEDEEEEAEDKEEVEE